MCLWKTFDINRHLHLFLSCPTPVSVFSCCCLYRPHISKDSKEISCVTGFHCSRTSCQIWENPRMKRVTEAHQLPLSNVLIPVHIVLNHLLDTRQQTRCRLHTFCIENAEIENGLNSDTPHIPFGTSCETRKVNVFFANT